MKKICIFLLMLSFISLFASACTQKQKASMVQAKRRFAQYVEPQQSTSNASGRIDLSEGPKLNYDAKIGPQNPSFEFKIVDPY